MTISVVAETRDERQTRTTRVRARPHMLPPELVVGRALMARQDPADQGAVLPEAGMALEVTPEDTAQAATQAAQAAVTPTGQCIKKINRSQLLVVKNQH